MSDRYADGPKERRETAYNPEGDGIAQKASKTRAEARSVRQRVCFACVVPGDEELGLIHSELPCQRCSKTPCHGIMTAGVRPGPA